MLFIGMTFLAAQGCSVGKPPARGPIRIHDTVKGYIAEAAERLVPPVGVVASPRVLVMRPRPSSRSDTVPTVR